MKLSAKTATKLIDYWDALILEEENSERGMPTKGKGSSTLSPPTQIP
jgi:hypothetical protein